MEAYLLHEQKQMKMSHPSMRNVADAFKESLDRRGSLDQIRANLRSQVFECLQLSLRCNDQEVDANSKEERQKKHLEEIPLINELIMEYFECIGYRYTLATFKSESAHDQGGTIGFSKDASKHRSKEFREIGEKIDFGKEGTNGVDKMGGGTAKIPTLYRLIRSIKRRK